MCNLYSITRSQEAIRRAFRVMRDRTGNLPVLPGIFADTMAPVVHTSREGHAGAFDEVRGLGHVAFWIDCRSNRLTEAVTE
jgi:hypothetical protein